MTADQHPISRLDALFSPERLRQNWEMKTAPVLELPQVSFNLDIHNRYHGLQQSITKKFPDASRLSEKFNEVIDAINCAFPLDGTAAACVDVGPKEAVVALLEELEELLWAMDLSLMGQG
ncbi:MAG: hypothetical protein ACNA7G_06115 [Methylobacter sp.]